MADGADVSLDAVLDVEQEYFAQGTRDGVEHGQRVGVEDGRSLGLCKGRETGLEIGFYRGCVDALRALATTGRVAVDARTQKPLDDLHAMLESFPLDDPTSEDVFERLLRIRAKFKVVNARMGMGIAFDEAALAAAKDKSF